MIKIVVKLLYLGLALNLISFNLKEISEDSTVKLDTNVFFFCREFSLNSVTQLSLRLEKDNTDQKKGWGRGRIIFTFSF